MPAHAIGQLVFYAVTPEGELRIERCVCAVDVGRAQCLDGAAPGLTRGKAFLELQHLGDLIPDCVQGVQGRHRLLEDHCDLSAPDRQQLALGQKQAEWRTDPARSGAGGTLGDVGSHCLNLMEYVTGDPVVTAYLGAPSGFTRCVLDEASTNGRRYEATWTVTPAGVVA